MPAARSRTTFIRDAGCFAARCAADGAEWDHVWEKIIGGCAVAGVELSADESMAMYEAWDAAYPWTREEGEGVLTAC